VGQDLLVGRGRGLEVAVNLLVMERLAHQRVRRRDLLLSHDDRTGPDHQANNDHHDGSSDAHARPSEGEHSARFFAHCSHPFILLNESQRSGLPQQASQGGVKSRYSFNRQIGTPRHAR